MMVFKHNSTIFCIHVHACAEASIHVRMHCCFLVFFPISDILRMLCYLASVWFSACCHTVNFMDICCARITSTVVTVSSVCNCVTCAECCQCLLANGRHIGSLFMLISYTASRKTYDFYTTSHPIPSWVVSRDVVSRRFFWNVSPRSRDQIERLGLATLVL